MGLTTFPCDVCKGGLREAVLFSCGANAAHGLPRTNEDKRRAVMKLLDDAEWSHWSDREIGRCARVSHEFVRKLRPVQSVTVNVDSEQDSSRTYTTKHGTVATMKIGNIGKCMAKVAENAGKGARAAATEQAHAAETARLLEVTRAEFLRERMQESFGPASQALGEIERFVEFCRTTAPATVAAGVLPHDVAELQYGLGVIQEWLDRCAVVLDSTTGTGDTTTTTANIGEAAAKVAEAAGKKGWAAAIALVTRTARSGSE
jgi:hypothetical protein